MNTETLGYCLDCGESNTDDKGICEKCGKLEIIYLDQFEERAAIIEYSEPEENAPSTMTAEKWAAASLVMAARKQGKASSSDINGLLDWVNCHG